MMFAEPVDLILLIILCQASTLFQAYARAIRFGCCALRTSRTTSSRGARTLSLAVGGAKTLLRLEKALLVGSRPPGVGHQRRRCPPDPARWSTSGLPAVNGVSSLGRVRSVSSSP